MAFKAGAIIGEAFLDSKQWTGSIGKMNKSNKSFIGSIGMVGGALAGALVAGLAASVKVANQFNKEFSNVRTLLDESQVDIGGMRKELLGLDARLGDSIDLTKGLYQALSASVEPSKAVKFVGESAKFAKAALIDTNAAVDVITTSLNAYGLEAEETTRISDVLFQTIKLGKTTGQELASTIGQVIPSASTLGVSMEELGASIATMTRQGINSAEATTQLNALMTAFIKPSTEMQEQLEKMGFASGSALLEADGLTGALEFLMEATDGNKEELAALLPNVRALKGAFALSGEQSKVFEEILTQMETSAGATDEAFQKQELTLETLGNQIQKVGIIIGERLLPFVYEIVTAFTDFISEGDTLGIIMGTLEVALSVFAEAWRVIKTETLDVMETLTSHFNDLTKDSNVDFFTLISGALKGLSIGFTISSKATQFTINTFVNFIKAIKEGADIIGAFFTGIRDPRKWGEVGKQIEEAGDAFDKFFKGIVSGGKDFIKEAINEFKTFPSEVEQTAIKLRDGWKNALTEGGGLSGDTKEELDNTKKELDNFTAKTEEETLTLAETMKENLKEAAEAILKFFDGVGGEVLKKIDFIANQFTSIFNGITGVVDQSLQNNLSKIQASNEKMLAEMETNKENTLAQKQSEFDALNEQLLEQREKGIISEEEFNEQKKILEEKKNNDTAELEKQLSDEIALARTEARKKENEEQKKIFEAQKGNQIANVWIQAALGVMGAWSQSIATLGPIAGSIFAGVLTTAILGVAAAQTATIANQQFVPAFQDGGMASGTVRVNEAGGEIITLPDGSQVIPNDISRQIAEHGGGREININITGNTISNIMDLNTIANHISNRLGIALRGN